MRILIVEDNFLIAELLQEGLAEAGHVACGIASTVSQAIGIAREQKPDLAVLDIDLADDECGTEVPQLLQAEWRIGFLFASGTGRPELLSDIGASGLLMKPYSVAQLIEALAIVADLVHGGSTERTHPAGFHLLRTAPPTADARA